MRTQYIRRATDGYSAVAALKKLEQRDDATSVAFYVGAILGLIVMGLMV